MRIYNFTLRTHGTRWLFRQCIILANNKKEAARLAKNYCNEKNKQKNFKGYYSILDCYHEGKVENGKMIFINSTVDPSAK